MLLTNKYVRHLEVRSARERLWDLMAVYASPNSSIQTYLWGNLDEIKSDNPWLVMGDFNCVLRGDERSSGVGVSSAF